MKKFTLLKNSIALRLLRVVFSIYLIITIVITLIQMTNEYLLEERFIRDSLIVNQAIFQENIAGAIWNIDDEQLVVIVQGILKQPALVGVKIVDENGNRLIKKGQILNDEFKPVLLENDKEVPLSYISLFQHSFNLRREEKAIGTVTLYSSNHVIFDKVKYNFLVIILNAVIKTMALWLLFIWAFNKFLTRPLDVFCQTMENIDVDNQKDGTLNLETFNSYELSRIEHVFNELLRRIIENRDRLYDLNQTLEQKVIERTQQLQSAIEIAEQANQKMSVAHKKLNDSIEYAKVIQSALLPDFRQVQTFLPHSFFIWQPRDIVGGDMLYVESFDQEWLVVVMDCTGHGVPGALMTMVAATNLRRITRDEGCLQPAEILKRLNVLVKTSLQQNTEQARSDDGLDAAICLVKPQAQQLLFAGAKLPLYYLHQDQMKMIKGDKQNLGYKRSDVNFNFTTHTLPLEPGMTFYLATDGLIDQLGGPKRLPVGKTRFQAWLLEHRHAPVAEQDVPLLKVFQEYQGENERLDDVTVVGFGV